MTRTYLDPPCPIAALATVPGTGAVAVIKTTGPGSIALAARCFSRAAKLLQAPGYTIIHGMLIDPESGEAIDEVLTSVFRSPRSHTGEDSVEFSCHGSPEAVRKALAALECAGFAPALPGEFSLRALLNGKTDLLRAEAVEELVRARGEAARAEALARLEGGLSSRIGAIRSSLLDLLADVESRLDYPEDEGPDGSGPEPEAIRKLLDNVLTLASTYSLGRLRREGALVVIAGRPNAGKSSLFNLLLREERSIVSEEPGTTRDWIEAWIEVDGLPVRLADTAGIRETSSGVESAGIIRALDLAARSDALIYLVDGRLGPDREDQSFMESHPKSLRVWNKSDRPDCMPVPEGYIPVSVSTGLGFRELVDALSAFLRCGRPASTAKNTMPIYKGGSSPDSSSFHSNIATSFQAPAETEIIVAGERQKILLDRTASALSEALVLSEAASKTSTETPTETMLGSSVATRNILEAESCSNLDIIALDLREAAFHLGEMTGEILSGEILEAVFSRFCLGK